MDTAGSDVSSDWERDAHVHALQGTRITLREIELDDRAALDAILEEPGVARWWRRDEWDRVLDGAAETFAITLTDASARRDAGYPQDGPAPVVGMIQYEEETDPDYRMASVDLFLSARVQGRGLGPEAIRTVVRHLVEEHGHHRFTLDPALENEHAISAYTKVGFKPVGVMRQYERAGDGAWRDALLMELLASELIDG